MTTFLLLLAINSKLIWTIAIFCILLLISLLLSKYSVEDDPEQYEGTFKAKEEDKEKFIDKHLLDEEVYGYRSLKTGIIYMIPDTIPEDEEIEPITRKEIASKGMRTLTNHIDSVIKNK